VLCSHVIVVPDAADIVLGNGHSPSGAPEAMRSAQRAIFRMQRELEAAALTENAALVLCDRGTVDVTAYWPGPDEIWDSVASSLAGELARYHAVVHLRAPDATNAVDEAIATAWAHHPRHFEVPASSDLAAKVERAVAILAGELPSCCRA